MHKARISVFGLGYVGAVSGACLAELGHTVIGVDVDDEKVAAINRGQSPIVEEKIDALIAGVSASKRFRATRNAAEAVAETDISWICVGTPSTASGGLETGFVRRVAEDIGRALHIKPAYHLVVLRSTVLPGTVDSVLVPALMETSGKKPGIDFGVCFHPEFLREGSSVDDFRYPPKIVIGSDNDRAADTLAAMYRDFEAPIFKTSTRAAEMVKYADNAFHALKVVFGNEIGTLCKSLGIDSHEVMRIFCEDKKLNISKAYLMPGFAYGGSCLPKDLRALNHLARSLHVELPVLANIQASNDLHITRVLDAIMACGRRNVGFIGLSFKSGTDDLRESPLVELAERLLGKGCNVTIYDPNVSIARLRGGNKAFIQQKLPHISELLRDDAQTVLNASDVIVAGASNNGYADLLRANANGKTVIDLVRLFRDNPPNKDAYVGVCW